MAEITFWLMFILVFYTYAGYPLALTLWTFFYSRPVRKENILPTVSIVVSAYNEEKKIGPRIENLIGLDYPRDKVEILVGSDGSDDGTDAVIQRYAGQGVKYIRADHRSGKPGMINRLVAQASNEIVVFADARQEFDRKALLFLVSNFADPEVGCVSGELFLRDSVYSTVGYGLGFYWSYEKYIRRLESLGSSMVGATGAIYAIRRALYVRLPDNILLDDVFVPMKIVEQGYRAVFEPMARAFDDVSRSAEDESRRKVRTLAGNWQIFVVLGSMLNPLRHSIALSFISHKLLRVLVPFFLIGLYVSNAFLAQTLLYQLLFAFQTGFYFCAIGGAGLEQYKIRLLNVPYIFCRLNIDAVKGFFTFIFNMQKATWPK